MGNRAVIAPQNPSWGSPVIYLHWNGGLASVEGFLKAARYLSINGNDGKAMQAIFKMIQKHYFRLNSNQEHLTVYLQRYDESDRNNGDNGVYLVDTNLNIVGRSGERLFGEEINPEKTQEIFECIISSSPIFND